MFQVGDLVYHPLPLPGGGTLRGNAATIIRACNWGGCVQIKYPKSKTMQWVQKRELVPKEGYYQ